MLFTNKYTHVNKILWRNSDLVPGSQAKSLRGLHCKNKEINNLSVKMTCKLQSYIYIWGHCTIKATKGLILITTIADVVVSLVEI